MITPQIPIAKEGYPFVGIVAFSALIFAVLGCTTVALLLLGVLFFVLNFFRDPERFTPEDENSIISPADGKILFVKEVDESDFAESKALKISIFMNVFNVHVNRIPISGTVDKIVYKPGKFYAADKDKASLENESCTVFLTTDSGEKIAFVQIAGLIARRIICWVEKKDYAKRGRRFGLIRFGSRVDIYLPKNTEITVKQGDKVRAGETILGYLSES